MNHPPASPWQRYVVQHHTGAAPDADHFDFMIELDDVLWTWQVDQPPSPRQAGPMLARRIADHRLAYLTYEGPISNGRGQCQISDRGRCRVVLYTPDLIRVELADGQGAGVYDLVMTDRERGMWELRPASGRPLSTPEG